MFKRPAVRQSSWPTARAALGALLAGVAFTLPVPALAATVADASVVELPRGDDSSFRREELVRDRDPRPETGSTPNAIAEQDRHGLAHFGSSSRNHHAATRSLYVSSPFGWRHDPLLGSGRSHDGIDLPGRFGAPVHATGAGVVSYAGSMSGYGNLVQIDHADGFRTRYGHLSRILVRGGERVGQGEVIGQMGSTGRSTGNHLHYEIRRSGQPVNPLAYMGRSVPPRRAGHDAQLDMVELGAVAPNRTVKARWTGWHNSPDGLPQAAIR